MSAPRPLLATERAALIMQLVPYLLELGEVSVADAAAAFEVAPEQMREMVEKLTVIGRPGDGGYWQLPNDLFDIDWDLLDQQDRIALTHTVGLERAPRLTAREAAALLAGLHLTGSLPGFGGSEIVAGLLAKLARGAASVPADVIVAPAPVDSARDVVGTALRTGVAVTFTYKTPDAAAMTRTVDPVKVHIADAQWYLQGWDHLRDGMRTFHLDRVSDLALTDIPVSHAGEPVPELFESGSFDVEARIRFPMAVAPLLGDYLERAQVEVSGAVGVATMRIADEHSLRRLAARRGGGVEILEPLAARRAAAEWAAAGLAQYGED
ncbi:YafY family protein [Microbacterium sp. cx-59]|uniref:helix-turn-helix transcriptional regulator n=1 Tax=Microbacterium sp. cx-59 TaxID=2891207 RepID=UPI001E2E2283|nr:WYL domain-containing protein [Microbacterium sp. cx-59]MCC4907429.1 WYL domain-containing protein [Microbacterium sp. cx-59]